MILPYTTVNKKPCTVLDLSSYPKIFDDVEKMFIKDTGMYGHSRGMLKSANSNSALDVFQVGSYRCSIATCLEDLDRVQASEFGISNQTKYKPTSSIPPSYNGGWRQTSSSNINYNNNNNSHQPLQSPRQKVLGLPENIKKELATYYSHGFGFLVCRIDADADFSPISYINPMVGGSLFVPTRHEGHSPDWDHKIYAFGCPNTTPLLFTGSGNLSKMSVASEACSPSSGEDYVEMKDFLKMDKLPVGFPQSMNRQYVRKFSINGSHENGDVVLNSYHNIANCKKCTFILTGENHAVHEWYFCLSCNLVGNLGCCRVCKETCHKNCNTVFATISSFYCDCGAGECNDKTGGCKAL